MVKRIVTHDGDVLDDIVWRHYRRRDVLVVVLEANPHLSQHPPLLEAGLIVELPDLPTPAEQPMIRLWS